MDQAELLGMFLNNSQIPQFQRKSMAEGLPDYLRHCAKSSTLDSDHLYLELGVFTGCTFSVIRNCVPQHITMYGFDTFEGLPEDWMIDDTNILYAKGRFQVEHIPNDTPNSKFIKGRIEDTLDDFLKEQDKKVGFVHLDMDLYSGTYYALNKLRPYLVPGTVLAFDDFYDLPGWQNHSFKALLDFANETNTGFEPLCAVGMKTGWASAAIKIV